MQQLLFLFFLGLLSCADAKITLAGSYLAKNDDYRKIKYSTFGKPIKLEKWHAVSGDKQSYSKLDTSDKDWKKVKVGQDIRQQGINGPWCWYRVNFDLPETWQGYPLVLDIGRISAYADIYLNGVKFGNSGSPPPRLKHGCSNVYWKYILQPELLRKGQNLLAFRVFIGYKGGLHNGAYTLSPLPLKTVCMRLPLKNTIISAESLSYLLTEAIHLNRFQVDSEISLTPELLNLSKIDLQGTLSVKLVNATGAVKSAEATELVLSKGKWQTLLIKMTAPSKPGKYFCLLRYSNSKENFIEKKIELKVLPKAVKKDFSIPVNTNLSDNGPLPIKVTPASLGRFGPRLGSHKHQLRDNLERTDSRSGMAYSIQVQRRTGGPKLFLANVRPVHEKADKVGRFHVAAGHKYDGVKDAWIYGYIRPNRAGKCTKLEVEKINWTGRTYHYRYSTGKYMKFSINAISPAWLLESDAKKLRVFDAINYHGTGTPQFLAYESNGKIKIVKASRGVKGADMSANWVLAWFNGGKNWHEFDTPYLFVLEKRPQSIKVIQNAALFFISDKNVGKIQGMPLFGVTLLKPKQTARWSKQLPEHIIKRCRFWSRVLAAPPEKISRTASVSYDQDRLLVRDVVEYGSWSDTWKTVGLKIVPVSTILPLTVNSGNLKIAVNQPVTDLHMATLQGPLVAAENTDKLIIAFDGLLHYLREVREVTPGNSHRLKEVKADFNSYIEKGYRKELAVQPWPAIFYHGMFRPGIFRMGYTNLILSRQWMNPEIRSELDKSIQEVSENYLLYSGKPDSLMRRYMNDKFKNIPVVTRLTNPVTGLKLAVGPMIREGVGIDHVYFSSLVIYMAWLYTDTYHKKEWVKPHYELLKEYFNTIRNSHDWSIMASWDTFSGLRVGNGLQESGGIYAGALGMTRLARSLKDFKTSDTAAYYAVMQLVSMQGTLNASEYLKQHRPWPATHSQAAEIEFTQKIRPAYFAELNELAGLSQLLIGTNNSASSPSGYIESPLPEVMRPYQEIWGKFTDEFYSSKIDAIIGVDRRLSNRSSIDTFIYQTSRPRKELDNIFKMRRMLHPQHDWWFSLPDYRGYLDSMSSIKYRKLW